MGREATKKQVIDLTTAAKRAVLSPRKTPYSIKLGKGIALLLYRGSTGDRWLYRTPITRDKVLGPAAMTETEDIPPIPTDTGLTFEQARADVFARIKVEGESAEDAEVKRIAAMTFGDVWKRYISLCEQDKTAQAMAIINSYGNQIEPLFDLPVSTTTVVTLQEWADGLIGTRGVRGKPRTKASVNKVIASMKAALNSAKIEGDWRKLTKYKVAKAGEGAVRTRERQVFTMREARAFVAEAGSLDHAFGTYCHGLMLTGARPKELSKAAVSDVRVNPKTGATELLIRFGKTAAKTGDRYVHLSPAGQAFFTDLAAGRAGNEVLFAPPEGMGERWLADRYRYMIKDAAQAMGKPDATLYAFRHGYITNAIYANVPLTSIARNCGTSVGQIEATYSHSIATMEQSAFSAFDRELDGMPKVRVVK